MRLVEQDRVGCQLAPRRLSLLFIDGVDFGVGGVSGELIYVVSLYYHVFTLRMLIIDGRLHGPLSSVLCLILRFIGLFCPEQLIWMIVGPAGCGTNQRIG